MGGKGINRYPFSNPSTKRKRGSMFCLKTGKRKDGWTETTGVLSVTLLRPVKKRARRTVTWLSEKAKKKKRSVKKTKRNLMFKLQKINGDRQSTSRGLSKKKEGEGHRSNRRSLKKKTKKLSPRRGRGR